MLKAWMKDNGVSIEEMAKKLGMSVKLFNALLNGEQRMTAKRIDEISRITNIPPESLLNADVNDFAGYTVLLRGGVSRLSAEQKSEILNVALLANDFERLKATIK